MTNDKVRVLGSIWQDRWHAARVIYRRDLRVMLLGWGIYLMLSLALLAAILLLRDYLNYVQENGLLVMSGAFNFPLFSVIFLSAVFLALSSVATIAREREQGTMEAIFFGPIDAVAYVLGKYLAQLMTYLVMALIYGGCFALFALTTNFTFPLSLGWVVLLSVLVASDVIAFGIFLSAMSKRVRSALLFFLGIVLILILLQFGRELLAAVPIQSKYYNPVVSLQHGLTTINQIVGWISPFSYLMQGMEAVRRGSLGAYLGIFLIALLFGLIFLALSVVALERRGVRR